MSKFAITLSEFNRIHQVIHGTIKQEGNPGKGCTFFACVGALILNQHFNIKARAVAGGFAMCVEPGKAVFFGRDKDGHIEWDSDGFHMWVQTDTHIIDFMSPIFHEAFAEAQQEMAVPRKMFQKQFREEAASLDALHKPGDFFTLPDADLTEQLIDHILERDINRDFIEIANAWYGKRRGPQVPTFRIGSNDGSRHTLTLPDTVARGSW
jgi:hypothetical protein